VSSGFDTRETRSGAFVAVDWGTSSFRAWLMAPDGTALAESRSSEGMQHCAVAGFEPVLRAHLASLGASDTLPVLICGMAGARQGWAEAPYLQTPAHLHALHEGAIRVPVAGEVLILPGMAQSDRQRPDVMRGEETQLLGVTEPGFTGVVCIPGTHSKWVKMEGGRVVDFTTYMTGELFAVLSKNSILAHAVDAGASVAADSAAFRAGIAAAMSEPADLTSALFRMRAAQLLGFEQRCDGAARLSGLLIGMEIAGALRHDGALASVRLIGAGSLGALYEGALRAAGLHVTVVDAEQASRQGLFKAALNLWGSRSPASWSLHSCQPRT
jgi:2-dehydro-3-deoxygalactonokinase